MRTRLAFLPLLAVLGATSGCVRDAKLQSYVGQWVLQNSGEDMVVLHTKVRHHRVAGTLTHPVHFEERSDGEFDEVSREMKTVPVSHGHLKHGLLLLNAGKKPDQGQITMTLQNKNHALLDFFYGHVPPMQLTKIDKIGTPSGQPEKQAAP